MKVYTLWQPWASLVAIGAKPYETRDYAPPQTLRIGDRFAIHAASMPIARALAESGITKGDPAFESMRKAFGGDMLWAFGLPLGAIVCTVKLAAVYRSQGLTGDGKEVRLVRLLNRINIPFDLFGNYAADRIIWHLTDIKPFDIPIPAKGGRGIWNWEPPAVEPKIAVDHLMEG